MVLIFASLFFVGLIFRKTFILRFFSAILEKLVCSIAKPLQCISRASKDCQSQVGRVCGISTEYRMVNGKVLMTYQCYTCHLYIDGLHVSSILLICRSSIGRGRPIINMAKCPLIISDWWSIDWHIGEKLSTDILVDTRPTYWPPYRLICRLSVSRYIGWQFFTDMSVDTSPVNRVSAEGDLE